MGNILGHIASKPIRAIFRRAGTEVVYNKLVAPYFRQKHAQRAVAGIVGISATNLGFAAYFNFLWRDIMNSMAAKDYTSFMNSMGTFAGLVLGVVAAGVVQSYISQRLRLSWARWAKAEATHEWLAPENRHKLVVRDASLQPEQRINNDITTFINNSEALTLGFGTSTANVAVFSIIVFALSPPLLAATFAMVAGGNWLLYRRSKELIHLNNLSTDTQNKYRNAIYETRLHGSNIAQWGGEAAAEQAIQNRLDEANAVLRKIIRANVSVDLTKWGYENLFVVMPYTVTANVFFHPDSKLGVGDATLRQSSAYNLRNAMDWYNNSLRMIIEWNGATERLTHFFNAIDPNLPVDGNLPTLQPNAPFGVSIDKLILLKPKNGTDASVLCKDISFDLKAGDRIVLTGPSGSGKTTLLKAMRGMFPFQDGQIRYSGVSDSKEIVFVPQGNDDVNVPLRDALTFPRTGTLFSDDQMRDALEKVGLNHLTDYLPAQEPMGTYLDLSGGEKQRLNFARLLLHKPLVIALDESTASLPTIDGITLCETLFRELPDSIIISIAHRQELIPLHNKIGTFSPDTLIVRDLGPARRSPNLPAPTPRFDI